MPRDEYGKRKTKKSKAKRNYELKGKFNSKTIRQYEKISNIPPPAKDLPK